MNAASFLEDMRRLLIRPVLPETLVLALVCAVDTAYTVFVVDAGIAHEANPLMAPLFEYGSALFVIVKTATFLVPLVIIEGIRHLNPAFVRKWMKVGIAGYSGLYVFGSISLHL